MKTISLKLPEGLDAQLKALAKQVQRGRMVRLRRQRLAIVFLRIRQPTRAVMPHADFDELIRVHRVQAFHIWR